MGKNLLWLIVPFCSIFIIVGGWLVVHTTRKIMLGCQAAKWPHAVGEIIEAKMQDTSDSDSHTCEMKVRYAFRVGDDAHEGTTIHACYGSSSIQQAHRPLEALLKVGTPVRVYYDPANPSRSCLSTGLFSGNLALVFVGAIFLFAGLGFLGTFWFLIAGNWNFASGIIIEK